MRAGPVSVPSPHFAMSQSTFVVGALGIAWILWLAANNKLATYWSLLIGGGSAGSTATPATVAPGSTGVTGAGQTAAPTVNPFGVNPETGVPNSATGGLF